MISYSIIVWRTKCTWYKAIPSIFQNLTVSLLLSTAKAIRAFFGGVVFGGIALPEFWQTDKPPFSEKTELDNGGIAFAVDSKCDTVNFEKNDGIALWRKKSDKLG